MTEQEFIEFNMRRIADREKQKQPEVIPHKTTVELVDLPAESDAEELLLRVLEQLKKGCILMSLVSDENMTPHLTLANRDSIAKFAETWGGLADELEGLLEVGGSE